MKTIRKYNRVQLGVVDGEPIYLSPPSWNCDWYWGFGYLGNENCHYHLDGLNKNINLHDAILEHFGESFLIRPSQSWKFAELIKTFYNLRLTAEVLGRGGSYLSSNPCRNIIINKDEVCRINKEVLPAVFDALYNIIEANVDNKTLFKKLVLIDLEGTTSKTIQFMKDNNIKPEDLKTITKNKTIDLITSDDFTRIHFAWYRDYQSKK